MSSYHKLPRNRKIATGTHGLKRVTARSVSDAGCPKIIEVWVPETKWHNDLSETADAIKKFCERIRGVSSESVYLEF